MDKQSGEPFKMIEGSILVWEGNFVATFIVNNTPIYKL